MLTNHHHQHHPVVRTTSNDRYLRRVYCCAGDTFQFQCRIFHPFMCGLMANKRSVFSPFYTLRNQCVRRIGCVFVCFFVCSDWCFYFVSLDANDVETMSLYLVAPGSCAILFHHAPPLPRLLSALKLKKRRFTHGEWVFVWVGVRFFSRNAKQTNCTFSKHYRSAKIATNHSGCSITMYFQYFRLSAKSESFCFVWFSASGMADSDSELNILTPYIVHSCTSFR